MPPRIVKRGAAASTTKRTARASKGAAAKTQMDEQEPVAPVEEVSKIEERPKVEADEKTVAAEPKAPVLEEKPQEEAHAKAESENKVSATVSVSNHLEEEVKESVDEYGKDERLELDDNEPDYEHEEYGRVDFDDKENEQEDVEDVEEVGEEPQEGDDENMGVEDEENVVEEELEEVAEELEVEDEEDHAGEEAGQAEMHDPEDEDEHHEVLKERSKRKEFEVFVGGLDKDATENDLRKVFNKVGKVTEVRLMMNPQTKKNKGFAFLRFESVEQAKRAVSELKNPVINGKQCGVSASQDSDTLFLGNICKTWTKEALKEKLKHYGVDNIEDMTLVEDSNNQGMNRGFAFLEFSSRVDAMDAFKRLQKRDVSFGVDRLAKVSFADSFIDPGDEIMAQVKTLFIDGLPALWDEDQVRELLKSYGTIEKVELARNMPTARRKDFGFVTFDTHDAAVTCAKNINNSDLGGGDNKAKVRARLSRPLQRGKGKHSSRVEHRFGRKSGRPARDPWIQPLPRAFPARAMKVVPSRFVKRPVGLRDRRPIMGPPVRARPPPPPKSYDRRPPAPAYMKSSMKREYSHHEELAPPRSRAAAVDYNSRILPERRPSYRDDYASRSDGYADLPRVSARMEAGRPYINDGYSERFERPPPSYREGRGRDYDTISGSKRPYSAMEDVHPRYANVSPRHSRARMDYELGPGASQYGDAYSERYGRSNVGYGSSRTSMSSHDSHVYGTRHSLGYSGSYGSSDSGGMYPSSYGSDYMSRGSDVGGSSYSSMYPGRGMGGSGYMGSGGSGSYY